MPEYNLLVVEDERPLSEMLRLFFSKNLGPEWRVQFVSTGADALRRLSTFPPEVMLLDIRLEETTTGIQVIHEMYRMGLREKPRVIVMSALNPDYIESEEGPPKSWLEQFSAGERGLIADYHQKGELDLSELLASVKRAVGAV